MELRSKFILAASQPGANVSQLSRDFGVSRTNAYKWLARFKSEGLVGLKDRSRRPHRLTEISGDIVCQLVVLRRQYPNWGPKKLRELLRSQVVPDQLPSVKTIGRVLKRLGEQPVRAPRVRRRVVVRQRKDLRADAPNDVWTVDFKGWWRTSNGKRFEPLTVRDSFSRYVLCLQMLGSLRGHVVKAEFERLFQRFGLPATIRVDNGAPFACTSAPAGLSRLSAWWTSLGIAVSFSRPACPQDNGGHERMHLDVATELEADPAASLELQQQAADRWRAQFNDVRPHEALGLRAPASLYKRSERSYRGVRQPCYPASSVVRRVSRVGCVRYAGKVVFISESVAGFDVALRAHTPGQLSVRFYDLDLGDFPYTASPNHRRLRLVPLTDIPKPQRRATA